LGNLFCQSFLNLKPPSKNFREPGNLADAHHPPPGNVAHLTPTKKGKQMVFTEREDLDIANDHHIASSDLKQSTIQDFLRILLVAAGKKLPAPGNPEGGPS
jgi:hypothetical protein